MDWRRGAWMGMWLVGCSSANPAFDPPGAGDTEATIDSSTTDPPSDDDGGTTEPTTSTGADGPPGVPGSCESEIPTQWVTFRIARKTDGMHVRSCGGAHVLQNCSVANTDGGWTLSECNDPTGGADGLLTLDISPPPDQILGTQFKADVVFRSSRLDEGCEFQWGVIQQRNDNGEPGRLVWAGSNVVEVVAPYPVEVHPLGPKQDGACVCGDVDACNPDYGPQALELCVVPFGSCATYTMNTNDEPLDEDGELYGVLVLRAWEYQEADVPGDYAHVVRLLTQIR